MSRNVILLSLLCLLILLPWTLFAADSLVAHYTFDGDDPAEAVDHSGNGFHGKITGAQRVPSPRGKAVRFDGDGDTITYGSDPQMAVEKDLTLLVWVKTDAAVDPATHRLIFGDTDGTINRNLNLRIDHQNQLRYEWGNGRGSHDALLTSSDLLDGTWRALAIVCDSADKTTTLYVDGIPVKQQPLRVPPTKTAFGRRLSGSWSWGDFKGDIDEIRLYSRALTEAEIRQLTRAQAAVQNTAGPLTLSQPRRVNKPDRPLIGDMQLLLDADEDVPTAQWQVTLTNSSETPLSIQTSLLSGLHITAATELTIPANSAADLQAGTVPLERVFSTRSDLYFPESDLQEKRLAISAAGQRTRLLTLTATAACEPLNVQVEDPWQHNPRTDSPTQIAVRAAVTGRKAKAGHLQVILKARTDGVTAWERTFPPGMTAVDIDIPQNDLPWGAYNLEAVWHDADRKRRIARRELVTRLPTGPSAVRPLNNLVSELMNARERGMLDAAVLLFMNPRDGWCWFEMSGPGSVLLDRAEPPLFIQVEGGARSEAMRYLPAGRYNLQVDGGPADVRVHAIPAVIYNVHQAMPRIGAFGRHTWERISGSILPSCTIVESSGVYPEHMQLWRDQGRKWVFWIQTPGLGASGHTVTVTEADRAWSGNLGYTHPLADGIQADEFITSYSDSSFDAFARSIANLAEDPAFSNRLFIPFVTSIHRSASARAFVRTVVEAGWPFSIERYLPEAETEADAQRIIDIGLVDWCRDWEEELPGTLRRAIITPMYAVLPYCTANALPTANFNVHLDMQLQTLANHPLFFGLYGVQPYRSNYADPEMLRWMGKLLRHYCIEGKRERLSTDPYDLQHLKNPDFDQELAQWKAVPAQKGSIRTETFEGLGTLQGRYPPSAKGDHCAVFVRQPHAPNKLVQTIENLTPGREYSVKCISVDYDHLTNGVSQNTAVPLELSIRGATTTHQGFHDTYHNVRGPRTFGPDNRLWFTFHWMVFRADAEEADITISDWSSAGQPTGPDGQSIAFNFVEVQPFVAE